MPSYTLNFKNNSTNSGTAILFQRSSQGYIMSVAWLAKHASPGTQTAFQWNLDYGFAWGETGSLMPGVRFEAAQLWPADLNQSNQVTLTNQGGSFTFMNQTQGQPGVLTIQTDMTIPNNQVSVGMAISGSPTMVVQARPNMNNTFQPAGEYWIAFGNFQQGEVLDVNQIQNAARIAFPPGVFSMTATLNANNAWTIQ